MDKKLVNIELKNVNLLVKLAVDSDIEGDRIRKLFECVDELRKQFGDHVVIEKLAALASGTIQSMEVSKSDGKEAQTNITLPSAGPTFTKPIATYQPPAPAPAPVHIESAAEPMSEKGKLLAHVLESPCFQGLPLSQWDPNFVFQKMAFAPWELSENDRRVITRYKQLREQTPPPIGGINLTPVALSDDQIPF